MLHRSLWIIKIEYRSKNENIGYVYILLYVLFKMILLKLILIKKQNKKYEKFKIRYKVLNWLSDIYNK